jgi:hypothetical protein
MLEQAPLEGGYTRVTASLTSLHYQSFYTSTLERLYDNFAQAL